MHVPVPTGRNFAILSPKVLQSFPSAYVICQLPGEHEGAESEYSGLVDNELRPLKVDWFNIADWKRLKIAHYSEPDTMKPEEEENLVYALADAKRFRLLTVGRKDVRYPPIIVLASDRYPSRRCIIKDGPLSIKGFDFESYPLFPGDGRVPILHARPVRVQHELVVSELPHDTILNDDRIPTLLEDLIKQVIESGADIYNRMHPKL